MKNETLCKWEHDDYDVLKSGFNSGYWNGQNQYSAILCKIIVHKKTGLLCSYICFHIQKFQGTYIWTSVVHSMETYMGDFGAVVDWPLTYWYFLGKSLWAQEAVLYWIYSAHYGCSQNDAIFGVNPLGNMDFYFWVTYLDLVYVW